MVARRTLSAALLLALPVVSARALPGALPGALPSASPGAPRAENGDAVGDTGQRASRRERPLHERVDEPSVATCAACHPAVFAEWRESLHARAWTNANVRAATKDFARESCRPCHSPRPMFETGLDRAPAFREEVPEDGVQCLACHGLADGLAAARTLPEAPCRPRYTPEFLEARSCYPCHQPTHGAFDEYALSDAKALGVRCVDCHMPVVAREGRSGRSHGPHGGLNEDFVRRAVRWSAEVVDGEVRLTLTNRTGHRFPGEIPSRSFHVRATYVDHGEEVRVLRKPFKGEERDDDRLAPDETRVLTFRPPAGAGEVRLRLGFSPLPLLPLEESFLLGEWSGRL